MSGQGLTVVNKKIASQLIHSSQIDLHTSAEHCDFGALHNQLIRDRIVVGIMDSKLSEQLQ